MNEKRRQLMEQAAMRGKYAPLYDHLKSARGSQIKFSFDELEDLLGFTLPNSAYIYRPWWANGASKGGHSQALAWEMAGWKTTDVDMDGGSVIFIRAGSEGAS